MDFFFAAIDGASRGNPGPAAVGLVLSDRTGTVIATEGRFIGIKTNNQAEYAALIFAVQKALALNLSNLKVQTDSELLYRQITGRYRILNPQLKLLHQQASDLIRRLNRFELIRVNREKNRAADKMANQALPRAPRRPRTANAHPNLG